MLFFSFWHLGKNNENVFILNKVFSLSKSVKADTNEFRDLKNTYWQYLRRIGSCRRSAQNYCQKFHVVDLNRTNFQTCANTIR